MAREHGPYSVSFPVDFTSKGDTTRDAFRKHMDEITRIYGILTGLDADTLDSNAVSEMLQKHIDSTNPHPNYKPSMTFSDITGSLDTSRLIGDIAASKVKGVLTGATIASGNVTGLEAFVKDKIPASSGDGITGSSKSVNGYAEFKNGLIVQWGLVETYGTGEVSFPKAFPKQCYTVIGATYSPRDGVPARDLEYDAFTIYGWDKTKFRYMGFAGTQAGCTYIAIGV